jgi:sugar phosphate isomerase/epimerase
MYAAIFSRTYPLNDAAAVFAAVAADGYKGVQANLSSVGLDSLPENLPPGIAARIGVEASARGIRIAALSGTYNMAHPDVQVRHAYRARFRNVVRAAVEMGTAVVTLCTGSRDEHDQWKFHPDNSSAAAWSDLRSELDFALGVAQEAGISLAIEPEPANVIHDARTARRILDEVKSPRLGIILDAANLVFPTSLAAQSEVMREAAGLLGDSLLLAHAKDIDAAGNVVAPGEGAVDLPAFVKALRSVGYDDALIAHGFSADRTGPAAKALERLIEEPA